MVKKLLILAISLGFFGQAALADQKAVTKFRKEQRFGYLFNSIEEAFTLPAKQKVRFFSGVDISRSTGSVTIPSELTYRTNDPSSAPESRAYLTFKLPPRGKKKKSKSLINSFQRKKSSKSKSKITRTVGIVFRSEATFSSQTREKVYSVKRFKKRKTKKAFIYSGLIKDGRKALGRFKVKVNK